MNEHAVLRYHQCSSTSYHLPAAFDVIKLAVDTSYTATYHAVKGPLPHRPPLFPATPASRGCSHCRYTPSLHFPCCKAGRCKCTSPVQHNREAELSALRGYPPALISYPNPRP